MTTAFLRSPAQGGRRHRPHSESGAESGRESSDSPHPMPRRLPKAIGSIVWAVAMTLLEVSTVAFGGQVAPSFIYGIDDTNILWQMDLIGLTSGTVEQTALAGVSNGLAYDTARSDLFAVDGQNNLWWWNQDNPQYAAIASAAALGIATSDQEQPWSAAYYNNSYWFFLGNGLAGTNQLRRVFLDYSSGQQPTVASYETYTVPAISGSNAFGDIAIVASGPNAGMLYAYTYSFPGNFYSLDLNAIVAGTVGGYQLINTTSGTGLQIAFNSDYSVLYGHNYDDGTWYTIDTTSGALAPVLTNSGTFTTLAGDGKGFRDLGGSAVQAVPEPGTLGLAAVGGAAIIWHTIRRRRRRVSHGRSLGASWLPAASTPLDLLEVG